MSDNYDSFPKFVDASKIFDQNQYQDSVLGQLRQCISYAIKKNDSRGKKKIINVNLSIRLRFGYRHLFTIHEELLKRDLTFQCGIEENNQGACSVKWVEFTDMDPFGLMPSELRIRKK